MIPLAALPEWIPVEDQTEEDPETGQRRSMDDYTGHRPGDDYNRRVERAEVRLLLIEQGARLVHSANGVDYFCRPGKTGKSYSGTLGHLPGNRLRSFSPNWKCFPSKKGGYQPFSIYAHLRHDGDFTAAMKALAAMGYGRNEHPPNNESHTAQSSDDQARSLPRINAADQRIPHMPQLAWDALLQSNNPPRLFMHGRQPIRYEVDGQEHTPAIAALTPSKLRYELGRAAHWYAYPKPTRKDPDPAPKAALPPVWLVEDMLARPDIPLPVAARTNCALGSQ